MELINKNMTISIDTIINSAELLQSEMHKFIDEIKATERGKKINYEDLQTIFFFLKIAELQKEIKQLKDVAILNNSVVSK